MKIFTKVEIEELLRRFEPAPNALFEVLRPSDDVLRALAPMEFDERDWLRLCRIRDAARMPDTPHEIPWEAALLARWTEPEDPSRRRTATADAGHSARAFACAILLLAQPEQCDNRTVSALLASALTLGDKALAATGRLLAWLWPQTYDFPDAPALALALLAIAAWQESACFTEAECERLADWVMAEDVRVRAEHFIVHPYETWPLSFALIGLRIELWRALMQRLLVTAAVWPDSEARRKVLSITTRILLEDPQDGDVPAYALEALCLLEGELAVEDVDLLLPLVFAVSPRNRLYKSERSAWQAEAWQWLQTEVQRFVPLMHSSNTQSAALAKLLDHELKAQPLSFPESCGVC